MRLMSIAQPMWDRLSCLSVLLVVNWEVLRLQYILTKIHILSEKRLSLSSTIHLKVDTPDDWGALYFNNTDPVSSYKYNINNIVYTFTLHAIIRYINWYNTIYIRVLMVGYLSGSTPPGCEFYCQWDFCREELKVKAWNSLLYGNGKYNSINYQWNQLYNQG